MITVVAGSSIASAGRPKAPPMPPDAATEICEACRWMIFCLRGQAF